MASFHQPIFTTQAEVHLEGRSWGPGRANKDNSPGADRPLRSRWPQTALINAQTQKAPHLPRQELPAEDQAARKFTWNKNMKLTSSVSVGICVQQGTQIRKAGDPPWHQKDHKVH